MKHTPYIAIIILLVVILILENKNHRLEKQKFLSKEHDFELKLQQTESELEATRRSRDSLNRVSVAVDIYSKVLAAKLVAKDKEIASIKGKYNNVPVDSLANLMNNRAQQWKN